MIKVAVVKHTNEEIALLARLMRAEAEGDGKLGRVRRARQDAVGESGRNQQILPFLDSVGVAVYCILLMSVFHNMDFHPGVMVAFRGDTLGVALDTEVLEIASFNAQ